MTSTPEVENLLADHSPDVAGIARRLRRTLLDGHPPLVERVRAGWHSINYRDPAAGFVCAVFPFADRVRLATGVRPGFAVARSWRTMLRMKSGPRSGLVGSVSLMGRRARAGEPSTTSATSPRASSCRASAWSA